ncbi:MAG TPA: hypothetical protein VIJ95_19050 [Hanamia sp.]
MKFSLIVAAAFLILSCNSENDKNSEIKNKVNADTAASASNSIDSTKTITNRTIIWTVTNEDSGKEKLSRPEDVKLDTFSSSHLIQVINENFPDIHLDLIKISHDTIFVKIPDSKKLTQGLGDSGAENYLASATYTLTELKNIKFVNFAMEAGDHAEPGVYSREDFKRLR